MKIAEKMDEEYYLAADKFFAANRPVGLTFDDISLSTRYSEFLPSETKLVTRLSDQVELQVPIISADMDTVTEGRMAIEMALMGGLGLIHYNLSKDQQLKEVEKVKYHVHGLIQEPIKVKPNEKIGDVIEMIERRNFSFRTFPVVDDDDKLVGMLEGRVVQARYKDTLVSDAMKGRDQLIAIKEKELKDDPIKVADQFFNEHIGINKLLVVNEKDQLRGLFTLTDIGRIINEEQSFIRPARDADFRLLCGAAISTDRNADGSLNKEAIISHVGSLVDRGLDVVAVSTAHGFSKGVGEAVRLVRGEFPDLTIIAGNVTSAEGVAFLADAGVNAVKVGQGPGSICTTRIVAGVGIPQMTALYVASKAAEAKGVKILADGGISKSGDIVKALTLADAVICGGILAGCREAPGRIIEINGKSYKQYRGMGSLEAMADGSAARYGHKQQDVNRKATAEGVEALKEVSGPVQKVVLNLIGGLRSGLGYLGADDLTSLKARARYIRVSPAGQQESKTHDVIEVKSEGKR